MTRLISIGFDAAPWRLIDRWTASGELPVLARLIREGGRAQLTSLAYDMPESCWPSLARGVGPATHGLYNWRGAPPGEYGSVRFGAATAGTPYWRQLASETGAPRTVILDVPHTQLETDDRTVHVAGWGERGGMTDASHPADELGDLLARFGSYPSNLNREAAGRPLLARSQFRTITRMSRMRTRVLLDLMERHPWELLVAAFHEVHYAGHAFHVYAEPDEYRQLGMKLRLVGELEHALLRCYQEADTSLGELLAAAPDDTHVAVFSGMGLRPATAGPPLMGRVLVALGYQAANEASPGSRSREFARSFALKVIPRPLARAIKRKLLDGAAIDAQLQRANYAATDWPATRAWAEGEPGFAFIRFNVRGREPDGCVDPADVAELQERLTADLLELRSAETGEPAVDAVVPIEELVGADPGNHVGLPDLVVRISRATMALSARHPRTGVIDGGRDGYRVTEHDDDGWVVLSGPKVEAGAAAADARIEDVAPTLIQLMGGSVPDDYEGRVLDELLAPTALPRSSAPRG